jgi:hypothetical protein
MNSLRLASDQSQSLVTTYQYLYSIWQGHGRARSSPALGSIPAETFPFKLLSVSIAFHCIAAGLSIAHGL